MDSWSLIKKKRLQSADILSYSFPNFNINIPWKFTSAVLQKMRTVYLLKWDARHHHHHHHLHHPTFHEYLHLVKQGKRQHHNSHPSHQTLTLAISSGSSKLGSLESTAPLRNSISVREFPSPDHVNLPPCPPFLGDPLMPVADFRSFLTSCPDLAWHLDPFPGFLISLSAFSVNAGESAWFGTCI